MFNLFVNKKIYKSSKYKLFAYLPVADGLFPLLLFFMSLTYDSLPQEAELGEVFLYLEDLWKVT